MNDDSEHSDDDAIRSLLSPLRAVQPSDEVCLANRDAVRRELDRRASLPWWRRSVAVPMPVAIAASLALVVAAAVSLRPALGKAADSNEPPQHTERVDFNSETPGWRITQSYILSIESLAQFQNAFRPETTEDRNES